LKRRVDMIFQNKPEIALDSLCVTASTLRYILSPFEWELFSNNLSMRMIEASVYTIRRIINISDNQYSYIRDQGTEMEGRIVEMFFNDEEKYYKQVKAERIIDIQGIPVKFRGTLDVYEPADSRITEIKYAVRARPKNLDGSSIPQESIVTLSMQQWHQWARDYAKKYDVQAQVQMLAVESEKFNFFIRSRTAESLGLSPNFQITNWKKDESFLEKTGNIILHYWEILHEQYEKFLRKDRQAMVRVYTNTDKQERAEELLGERMKELIDNYIELCEKKTCIDMHLERVKKAIEQEAIANELTDFKIKGFSLKKTESSTVFQYSKLVKDKGILDSLTEEEKMFYSYTKDGGYTMRYTPPKEDSFDAFIE
jgi:hypothetical protein